MAASQRWLGSILWVTLLSSTGCGTLEVWIAAPEPEATSPSGAVEPLSTPGPSSPTPLAITEAAPALSTLSSPSPGSAAPPTLPAPPVSPAPPSPTTAATTPSPAPPTLPPASARTPRAFSFSADHVGTREGEGVLLEWEAAGERVTICPLIGGSLVGCRCLFDAPLLGSHTLRPADIIGAYTGFELVVEAGGIRSRLYAPLTVDCPDARPDWFFDGAPGICPREDALASRAAAQRFERGLMVWIEALDAYYVLADRAGKASGDAEGLSSLMSLYVIRGRLLTTGSLRGRLRAWCSR